MRLKIGVIGTGHMGRNHVRNIASEPSLFDFIGIFDSSPEQAEKIASEYSVKAFSNLDELLDQVDAVVIAVPSSLHKEIGLRVAAHHVHALIEKPLATTAADAIELTEAFAKNDLKLQVGHIERFNPVIIELKKLLDNTKVFYIEAHRYSPFSGSGRITDVSVVEDLMIHDVDLICYLMDPNKVTDIRANGEIIRSNASDFATCMLDFDNKAHAVICASRVSQSKERAISIHTSESFIYADLLTRSLSITKNTDIVVDASNSNTYTQEGVVQRVFVPSAEPLRLELIAFQKSVTENAPITANGEVGIEAVRICEEANKRIKENR